MNQLWNSQVQELMNQSEKPLHYKQAEVELFRLLYMRMLDAGYSVGSIKQHFLETFGIKHTAFYTRQRKVGKQHVLRRTNN